MTIRVILSLIAGLCTTGPLSTYSTAAQTDRSMTSTKKSGGQFDLNIFLNNFFQGGEKATRQALQQNLDIITTQLGKETRAQELGFGTDPRSAKIPPETAPFLVFHVGLKSLRAFAHDKEVSDLLTFTNQLIFPVAIKGKVASSVTVRLLETQEMNRTNREHGWRITRWGLPKLIHQLNEMKEKSPTDSLAILVSIPALNRNFLGYEDATDIKFVPLESDPLFKKGEAISAKQVLLTLAQEAKRMDDRPR